MYKISKKAYEQILMKCYGGLRHGSRKNHSDIFSDPDSFVDPGSFSRILYHHEIGRKVTFCSASQQIMNGF